MLYMIYDPDIYLYVYIYTPVANNKPQIDPVIPFCAKTLQLGCGTKRMWKRTSALSVATYTWGPTVSCWKSAKKHQAWIS